MKTHVRQKVCVTQVGQCGKPTEEGAGTGSALLAWREGLNVEGKQINIGP